MLFLLMGGQPYLLHRSMPKVSLRAAIYSWEVFTSMGLLSTYLFYYLLSMLLIWLVLLDFRWAECCWRWGEVVLVLWGDRCFWFCWFYWRRDWVIWGELVFIGFGFCRFGCVRATVVIVESVIRGFISFLCSCCLVNAKIQRWSFCRFLNWPMF